MWIFLPFASESLCLEVHQQLLVLLDWDWLTLSIAWTSAFASTSLFATST
jgi:hypothetical protein